MRKWKLRTRLRLHQDGCQNPLWNLLRLDDDGSYIPESHEKFFSEAEAVRKARGYAERGIRCEVTKDIAACYGVE